MSEATDIALRLTDTQWLEISSAPGNKVIADSYRRNIEILCAFLYFLQQRVSPGDEKKRVTFLKTVAKCDALLKELKFARRPAQIEMMRIVCAGITGQHISDHRIEQEIVQTESFLTACLECANEGLARPEHAPSYSILHKYRVWTDLGMIYQQATGLDVGVSINEKTKLAHGPFVRFLQAITHAVPGSDVPSGHEVRAFVRRHWLRLKENPAGDSAMATIEISPSIVGHH